MARKPQHAPDPRWTPVDDCVAAYRLSRSTLYRRAREGSVRRTRRGSDVFFSAADLDSLLDRNATELAAR
ncbi:DNA-binding protein [Methylosinus trichosporium OB3b]|uniref:DNA-binding protein n=1 Tax=Methylosinus trichosporium (strain ATCC 35070 / NCIMB 11131 / UNIQEM 75 / OB3b) TaxID=595536 RepID=A0A2D2CZ06_METT3|nr:DNA-binding protein [Methylosinus trichosporium OB3b]OBS53794.1 hypothetical protein A8B73_04690 [Methylosinus sp. 3S-1]